MTARAAATGADERDYDKPCPVCHANADDFCEPLPHWAAETATLRARVRALEGVLAEIAAHGCEQSLHGCAAGDMRCPPCIALAALAGGE